jgi:large subunit ribosomal protein L25
MAEDTKEKTMSERFTLNAAARAKTGKNVNRRLRAAGIIPAVFYAAKGESLAVQVSEAPFMRMYENVGRTSVFDLEIDDSGKKIVHPCLVWDAEYYPTKNRFQHIDFYGVDLDKELKIRVPLEFSGTPKGTKLGGNIEAYREHIEVLSKPAMLPKKIVVDIAELEIGQGLRVADLVMPEGVRASYDDNYAIISVVVPGSEEKEEAPE